MMKKKSKAPAKEHVVKPIKKKTLYEAKET
jgi:hypothetical protein